MKYEFYSDPSQSWLKVSIAEIKYLGILSRISGCSYVSNDRKFAFLEEKQDAQTFIDAVLAADWYESFDSIRKCTKQYYCDLPSFILNLKPFVAAEFASKPVAETNQVFHF